MVAPPRGVGSRGTNSNGGETKAFHFTILYQDIGSFLYNSLSKSTKSEPGWT